jgi:hypothetical protein
MCFNRQVDREDGASPSSNGGGQVSHCRTAGAAVAR